MRKRHSWAAATLVFAAAALLFPGCEQRPSRPAEIRPDVLAQIEKELARLDVQAEAEVTQVTPSPSRAVAFYMLAGLANSASPVNVPANERSTFEIDQAEGKFNGKLYRVKEDLRIAFVDKRLRDKSGWYVLRFGSLFRNKEGSWVKQGWGHVIPAE